MSPKEPPDFLAGYSAGYTNGLAAGKHCAEHAAADAAEALTAPKVEVPSSSLLGVLCIILPWLLVLILLALHYDW